MAARGASATGPVTVKTRRYRFWTSGLGGLSRYLAVGLALVFAGDAMAADYRVRWQPSQTTGVTGYNVYVRPTNASYGAPGNAGLPAVAGDGSMSFVVTGLQAGLGYRFAVAAVRAGVESAFSNELGVCGANADCADGNPCTSDVCTAGRCTNPAANEGTSCADSDPCDGVETCRSGVCQSAAPLNCNDNNACTTDGCNASIGCTHALVSGCQACTSSATCSDGNACDGAETCQGGLCRTGSALSCNDGNPCTVDTCSAQAGCANAPLANCRTCGTSAECGDGNACNGAETCQSGRCRNGTAPSCSDGDPCTTDACEPAAGCTHELLETCFACESGAQASLRATRVTIKRSVYGIHYRASGMLQPTAPVDPTQSGLVFDIRHFSTGEIYYRAIVPGSALNKGVIGNMIRLDTRQKVATAEGIRYLRIRMMSGGRMLVAVFGKATRMPASFPVDLGWTMMVGDQCGADSCTAYARRTECD